MQLLKLILILLLFPPFVRTMKAQHLYWEKIGDFSYVFDLKINFTGHIFACRQESGSIRRSTDDGQTWEILNIPGSNIGNLAVSESELVFASDEYNLNNSIYKSDDNGNSWVQCSLTGGRMRSLYASQEGYIYAGNEDGQFFKSTDDGTTWTSDSVTDKQINCIGSCSNGQIFLGTAGAGIFSSTDFGNTWFQLYNPDEEIYSIVINDSDYIFVTNFNRVLLSKDFGNTWDILNIPLYTQGKLGIDSTESIYVSTYGVNKSTDNGMTWSDLGGPSDITAIQAFGDKIYLATYSGVFRYDPDVTPPNLLGSEFLPLHTNNKWQYLETTNTSDGNSYALNERSVIFDTLINNKIYFKLSNYNDLIRYSNTEKKIYLHWNDSDYVWVDFNVPLDNIYQAFGPWHYNLNVLALGGEHHIFGRDLVYGGIRYVTGSTISEIVFTDSIGITSDYTGLSWGPLWGYDDDLIEAILYDSTGIPIYITNHKKPEFDLIPVTSIDTFFFSLNFKIYHNYTRILWGNPPPWLAGLDFIDSVKMFSRYSKDESTINNPILIPNHQNYPVNNDFSVNIQIDTALLKQGYSFDYRFTAKDKGIIPEYTNAPDSGYYQCVWQEPSDLKITAISPDKFLLEQNYPNPFNPVTKIKYQIPEPVKVKLTVYDVLGRQIKILANEEKPAGSYEVEFDGTRLPSGVYFYRIEAGKYSDTKKFVLLK